MPDGEGRQNEEILSTFAREVFFGLSCKNLPLAEGGTGRVQPLYNAEVETIKVILFFSLHLTS